MPTSPVAPSVVVLGGPNGAGKSTSARRLLRGTLRVDEFVNADTLALGLSAFRPEKAAVEASRILIRRLEQLASARRSFAFESTLASRGLSRRLEAYQGVGYTVHVVYLWLPSVELALARVANRVRAGGHDVPTEVIRRRFHRGRRNFFEYYRSVGRTWRLYDAAHVGGPRLIALGGSQRPTRVVNARQWRLAAERYLDE